MFEAVLSLVGSNSTFYLLGAAIIGVLIAYMNGRLSGARLERDKQIREEAKARDLADQVDNDLGALTPAQKRENLKKWSKS